jgi:hypothetical protein
MSNARDKANIPSLNFSSTGIDDNATSTAITIDSSENVGIGTASPNNYAGYGNITLNGTSGGIFDLGVNGTRTGTLLALVGETRLSSITYIPLTFSTNNAERMRITSSGNVGIGTTSPQTYGGFAIQQESNTSSKGIAVVDSTNSQSVKLWVDGTNSYLSSGNTGADPLILNTGGGNVGIGTSSPARKFSVNASTDNIAASFTSTDANCNITFVDGSTTSEGYVSFGCTGDDAVIRSGNIESMRIDSSGNVGIGTSSPNVDLNVVATNGGNVEEILELRNNSTTAGTGSRIRFVNSTVAGTTGNSVSISSYRNSDGDQDLLFETVGTEAMRITSDGNVLVGKTTSSTASAGGELLNGVGGENAAILVADSQTPLVINRLTNDGVLVSLRQAGTQEGNISVSGATVTYNGFTGTHWSRFTDNSTPNILRGTVLETLDEMCDWYNLEFDVTTTTQDEDGNDVTNTHTEKVPHVLLDSQSNGDVITYNHEGTDYQATIVKENDVKHMMSKVSDTTDAKNVYGVFVAYDEDGEGYNDFYVASVGSFVVRIKANETIAKGDLLQSNGDGTAKVQTDDNVKSSSFAKVLSTTIIETYEDGSYLVPCSLMC